jgi:hypothetical protein
MNSFVQIEKMYRSYELLKTKLTLLNQRNLQVLNFGSSIHNPTGQIERLQMERADIASRIDLVQTCLTVMTSEERLFIESRYFQDLSIVAINIKMNCSEREIYRLRKSVLSKTQWLLEISERKMEHKTS